MWISQLEFEQGIHNAFRPGSDHRTKYTHDGLYRLKKAEEGNGAGSNFTASYGTEDWAPSINSVNKPLSQTGNWNGVKRTDPAWGFQSREIAGTFNRANELLALVGTVVGSSVNLSPVYSPNGELIDDGAGGRYTYKHGAWGRLTQVNSRATPSKIISKYKYNGLGYRIGWQYRQPSRAGANTGIVDGTDPWYWLVYNDRWQQIAAYRLTTPSSGWTSDSNALPKEIITHHMAGMDGAGGSRYIDSVVTRDRDNAAWNAAAQSGTGPWANPSLPLSRPQTARCPRQVPV